jgi:hypothetical protein
MDKARTQRAARANEKFEEAARQSDKSTHAGRAAAARLITAGNAIKRGQAVPDHARGGKMR